MAKLFFTLLAAFAEWERDRTRERILDAKDWARDQGRFLGGVRPFGYRIVEQDGVKMLEPEPVEQEVIGEMVRLHDQEGATIYRLTAWAKEKGYGLSTRTVAKILERAVVAKGR
jgi:DNA invertase Pin-like site-specific DNA recombinase